jgi:hypothetical protein
VPRPARSSSLALLALLLAALLLAGCGGNGDAEAEEQDGNGVTQTETGDGNGDDDGVRDVEPETNEVTQAAEATTEAGSANMTYEALFEGAEGSYSFTADGQVDYESQQSRLEYDMSNLPGMGAEDVEVRFDGPTVFVRFPDGPPDMELPEGKDWIRVPPPEVPEEEEEAPAAALDLGGVQQDPTQFVRFLVTGATDVQEEGTEEVRGEQTTVYTALIDLDRVRAGGGRGFGDDEAGQAAGLRAAEALRAQLGGVGVPVTVNVDGEGRIVRLLLSFDLQTGAAGGAVSALTTTEYYDFGTDVDVAPPPEEQVIDAADVE